MTSPWQPTFQECSIPGCDNRARFMALACPAEIVDAVRADDRSEVPPLEFEGWCAVCFSCLRGGIRSLIGDGHGAIVVALSNPERFGAVRGGVKS